MITDMESANRLLQLLEERAEANALSSYDEGLLHILQILSNQDGYGLEALIIKTKEGK